jgi:hypothetical protein
MGLILQYSDDPVEDSLDVFLREVFSQVVNSPSVSEIFELLLIVRDVLVPVDRELNV